MDLALKVVFDDAGARGFGKAKQLEAATDRHQPPGRILVRRGNEDQPGRFLVRGNEAMPCASSGMAETLAPAARNATSAPP